MNTENDPQADHIRARRQLARGVVVLDAGLDGLKSALREANILVVECPEAVADDKQRETLLSHRILITRRPDEFIDDAPVHEFGIVSVGKLRCIDCHPRYRENQTAKLISRALSRYRLWAKGARFLLELREEGEHRLQPLD